MLGSNYLNFDGVALPNPVPGSLYVDYENIVNRAVSETGGTVGNSVRKQKRTISATFNCTSKWLDEFKRLCALSTGILIFRGEQIEVEPLLTSGNLEAHSEYAKRTDGLWPISISFAEV